MSDLKIGLQLGYWQSSPPTGFVELVQHAERLGFDSVWTAEAYGSDALTPLAWIGAAGHAGPGRHRDWRDDAAQPGTDPAFAQAGQNRQVVGELIEHEFGRRAIEPDDRQLGCHVGVLRPQGLQENCTPDRSDGQVPPRVGPHTLFIDKFLLEARIDPA